MNKDKIIKDLKERNDKLENQRRQFELRLYYEQHLVEEKDKEIERLNNNLLGMNNTLLDLHIELIKKQQKINEALEYVFYLILNCKYRLNDGHLRKLKKILENDNTSSEVQHDSNN